MGQLATQGRLKGMLQDYFTGLASGAKPVAWCTSVGPAELLRSFGYDVYFPENHGALIGAKRLGTRYIPRANQAGFSSDICSYLTSDIGAYCSAESPLAAYGLEGVPKPDLLVYNTNQCGEVKIWFDWYHRRLGVPLVGIETPRDLDELSDDLLGYLEGSWEALIARLESITGSRFDEQRFSEISRLSHEACALWQEFLESAADQPAGHNFFDHTILMAPVVVLRGTPEAVDFYRELLAEVRSKDPGEGDERYRLYWDGMPIWGKLRFFSQLFADRGAKVVASTYCHSWIFDFLSGETLPAAARAYSNIFITRSQSYKLDYLAEMSERFSIDGVLFHDAKTCPHNTNSRFAIPARLGERTGKPSLTFSGDLVDLRHFSEAEFTLRLDAFLEGIDERRDARP